MVVVNVPRRKNRAERAYLLLSQKWCSSMTIIREVGTVSPSKVLDEVRHHLGVTVERRRRNGINEYRVAR